MNELIIVVFSSRSNCGEDQMNYSMPVLDAVGYEEGSCPCRKGISTCPSNSTSTFQIRPAAFQRPGSRLIRNHRNCCFYSTLLSCHLTSCQPMKKEHFGNFYCYLVCLMLLFYFMYFISFILL